MTLNIIGIGLNDEKDITLKGLELIKKSDIVFLEYYTSKLQCDIKDLENLYKKKITIADRDLVEKKAEKQILEPAREKEVSFLVIGDALCATTHIDLITRAKEKNIKVNIIHNASIISAIGITGLEVYKFGKITSIPFEHKNISAPIEVYKKNKELGLHTLFLLDLDPSDDKFLKINETADYLIKKGIKEDTNAIGCSNIGSKDPQLKYAKLKDLKHTDFSDPPFCLVIPGNLHFMEEEFLEKYN